MISSAKFSAMVLMDLMDFSLHPLVMLKIATLTLLKGDTSTACLLTTPPDPILVESSLGPALITAFTKTSKGFSPVSKWMISKAFLTMLMALAFLPVFLPWYYIDPTNLSTIGHKAFLNLLTWYLIFLKRR